MNTVIATTAASVPLSIGSMHPHLSRYNYSLQWVVE